VCVVVSNHPHEGRSESDGGDGCAKLPFRTGGAHQLAHSQARAELRDRETYYTELRFAVHCQSRSIPQPRAALDDRGADAPTDGTGGSNSANGGSRTDGESWDDIIARFGDTWT